MPSWKVYMPAAAIVPVKASATFAARIIAASPSSRIRDRKTSAVGLVGDLERR
jgi:hypothetical protein